jgi:hypothetical protein
MEPIPEAIVERTWQEVAGCSPYRAKKELEVIKMKPAISDTGFGYITVEGSKIEHDIVIRLSGKTKKRKKKLSKAIYGTSHTFSLEEAKYIYQGGAKRVIIGSGQEGKLSLAEDAAEYFKKKKCSVDLQPTPEAIESWNKSKGPVIGLFHVTC